MKLLFVHEVNWREKVVYEIHDFPELLSLRGHEVVFIDFPEGRKLQGVRCFLDLKTETAHDLSCAHPGAKVEVRTPGRVLPPPLDRLVASVTQIPALWKALADERFDAVVLYSVPTNGWQTVLIARHFGIPVLFRSIDISHMLRKTLFAPLIRMAERFIYRRVDALSTHNEPLRRYCIKHGVNQSKTSVEYPGLDIERFSPGERNPELCRRYGIESHHKVILFMGTFYRFAGIDWLLEASVPMLKRLPERRLMLIGGGEAEPSLRDLTRRLGIADSVIFTGFVNYKELPAYLRLADVAVNSFRRSLVTDCALPGKVLQYLGCGLPTISTPLPGLQSMLTGEKEGIIYRNLDSTFIEAAENLLLDDTRWQELAQAARFAMERLCRWEVCIEAFETAIQRMTERKKRRAL